MKSNSSLFKELRKSFRYMIESRHGKYSLSTYLEIVGQYADTQIIEARKNGLKYIGGECVVNLEHGDPDKYVFSVEMFFVDQQGQNIRKTACRKLDSKRFTRETKEEISSEKNILILKNRKDK